VSAVGLRLGRNETALIRRTTWWVFGVALVAAWLWLLATALAASIPRGAP
jgi:hypothetical protein